MVTILECTKKRHFRLFENIPEIIHTKDPYFIPPFPGSVVKSLGSKSPLYRHGERIPLIAFKNGQPVGRLLVIINKRHNEHYQDRVGFIALFDAIEDDEVSSQLFERAGILLKKRECHQMRGPWDPSWTVDCGLLVDGFEASPFVLMPYNPSYYLEQFEKNGFKPIKDLYAYYLTAGETPEKIGRIVNRVKRSTGITIRSLKKKELNKELVHIHELFNASWNKNWGFIPAPYEDFEWVASDLKEIIDPNLVFFAERAGKTVGFSIAIPNINEFLLKVKHSPKWLRVIRFLWYLKTRRPLETRIALLGIHPDFRNSGIAPLFYYETLLEGRKTYVGGELSWVLDDNELMMRGIEAMGGTRYKTYRVFEKDL